MTMVVPITRGAEGAPRQPEGPGLSPWVLMVLAQMHGEGKLAPRAAQAAPTATATPAPGGPA